MQWDWIFWIGFYMIAVLAIYLINSVRPGGKKLKWKIGKDVETELISNQRLQTLQRQETKGGILRKNDLVIVWAQNFLDHDIFYNTVKNNIEDGVRYFYILDRRYVSSFRILLQKLYADFQHEKVVNDSIDAIFIKSELTLNNFVLMAPKSDREVLYSSLIYDDRPIGWVRQSVLRARRYRLNVLSILTQVAKAQAKAKAGDGGFFNVEDQIMDFSHALRLLEHLPESEAAFEDFPTGKIVAVSKLDQDSLAKVKAVEKRISDEVRLKEEDLKRRAN